MTLRLGDQAPDFTLPSTEGGSVTLSALFGRPVLIYFYPKDDTPGCTLQACGFRDNSPRIEESGVVVLGISKDSLKSHLKFKEKFALNFPLLSDETGGVLEAYGVWVEKSMAGKKYRGIERTTFLIDATGKIARIWPKVNVDGHADETLQAVEDLRYGKTG